MKPLQASRDARCEMPRERLPRENPDSDKARVGSAALLQRAYRRIALIARPRHVARKVFLRFLGAHIGRRTAIPQCSMPWPHQVWIGDDCRLEPSIYFKFDWYWKTGPNIVIGDRVFIGRSVEFNIQGRIEIGDDCLIASGCVFVDHNHGVGLSTAIADQPSQIGHIILGKDVWIGANSVILKNVRIGDGAIIGAGSVVTKPIPTREVWAGNPAHKIRDRK
jgi:acetyltransferase-like isoleucine patch superfamily enzyme